MGIFRLKTGNERVRHLRRKEDTVVVESGSRRDRDPDRDIGLRFESQDQIALQKWIHNAILVELERRIYEWLSVKKLNTDSSTDVNKPPVAVDDFASTQENTPENIFVLDKVMD